MLDRSGRDEAIILVKASPVIGAKHGETVCCAGINLQGQWLRLFPVSFRVMEDAKKFRRWDRVAFRWRQPSNDDRIESRHIDTQSLEILGRLKKQEHANFLDRRVVISLNAERAAGRSLALLKPQILRFWFEKRRCEDVEDEQDRINSFHAQADMFIPAPAVPRIACPYDFKYEYKTEDGLREGRCQDWETTGTYFKWRNLYGEVQALKLMEQQFGEVLPARGLYFAMGTHSRWPDTWLINGLIQFQQSAQGSLF